MKKVISKFKPFLSFGSCSELYLSTFLKMILISVFFLTFFTGCLSIYVPPSRGNGRTMLIIKSEIIDETKGDFKPFGYIRLTTKNDNKEYSIDVHPKDGYLFYDLLPPGKYTDWKGEFIYYEDKRPSNVVTDFEIILEADTITLLPIKFTYYLYSKSYNSMYYNFIYTNPTPFATKAVANDIMANKSFQTYKNLYIGTELYDGSDEEEEVSITNDETLEGYNKSSVLKHPKIQLKEQKDETV